MAGELSGILEHVDRIAALDLDGVEPTSHVVALENVLRADEPRPEPAARAGPGARARSRRRRLPRPLPAGVSAAAVELIELTVAEAAGADRAPATLSARRVLRRLRARRRRATRSTPTSGRGDAARPTSRAPAPRRTSRGGRPLAGSRSRSRTSSAPRGSRPRRARGSSRATAPLHGDRGPPARRGRGPACSARPTWTSSRWAPRTRTPATARCSTRWDRERVPGGSSGGSAAAVAGRLAPCAIGTDTGGSIRQPAALCGIVGLKPTYGAISRYGMIAFASSLDQCGPLTRDVADAALLLQAMQGRDRCDSTSVGIEGGVELPTREDLTGSASGSPGSSPTTPRGSRPASPRSFERTAGPDRGARRRGRGDRAAARGARHLRLLRARAGGGLGEPGALRRRPLRAPGRGRRTSTEMYEQHPRGRASAPRSSAGSCSAPTRSRSGYYEAYYGRAQRVRTKIAEDFASAFERFDFVVTPTSPTVAFKLGAKTADPLAMYLSDYCTVPMSLAGIPAISIPAGVRAARRRRAGAAGRLQIAGPAFGDSAARRRPRARARDRLPPRTRTEGRR